MKQNKQDPDADWIYAKEQKSERPIFKLGVMVNRANKYSLLYKKRAF